MKAICRKINSKSGETLTETLVSVLIISIVSVALASMIGTASKVNKIARDYDEKLDKAIETLSTGTATPLTVNVKLQAANSTDEKNPVQFTGGIYINTDMDLYRYTYTVTEKKSTGNE